MPETVLHHPNLPGITYSTHEDAVPVHELAGWHRSTENVPADEPETTETPAGPVVITKEGKRSA